MFVNTKNSNNKETMNFLSIDCSTDFTSLFIKTKNNTFSKVLQSDKSNNNFLMKQILDFFAENNLKLDHLDQIFVNQGPGNFSGLRSSLAVAKGISLAKKVNLSGYDTFILCCAKFFKKKIYIYSFVKVRDKYFVKMFNKNLNKTSKVKVITKEQIIKNYKSKFKVIPKNMKNKFDKHILKLGNLKTIDLDHNELEFLKIKGLLSEDLIKPLYLS